MDRDAEHSNVDDCHEDMDLDMSEDFETPSSQNTTEDYSQLLEGVLSVHVIKSKIFSFLSPHDIKNTVLVSRKLKEIVEVPSLWKWAIVRMHTVDLPRLDLLLHSQRFRLIESIQLKIDNPSENNTVSSQHLREIHKHLKVLADFIEENHQELELRRLDLDLRIDQSNLIPPSTLMRAVHHLVEVNFSRRGAKRGVRSLLNSSFFRILANATDINVERLGVSNISLDHILSEDLSSVVSRLKEVDLSKTDLNPSQLTNIFETLSNTTDSLDKLDLSYNDLGIIDSSQLARVVCSLRTWEWVSCHLSSPQIAAIVQEMADSPRLRLGVVSFNENLAGVEENTLARAIVRLETVKFFDNKFSSKQLDELFRAIVKSVRLDLKILEFSHCNLNLSSVELLARAVCRLEKVDLVVSSVSKAHSNAIFRQILQAETLNLRDLTLECPPNLWGDNDLEKESSKKLRSYVGPRFKKYNL